MNVRILEKFKKLSEDLYAVYKTFLRFHKELWQ